VAIISGFKWHLNLSLVGATGPKVSFNYAKQAVGFIDFLGYIQFK